MDNLELEISTIWSFPERGTWVTHNPKYRGNFAPQIARNVISRYSKEGDLILDPMVGGGTSLIEAKLLNRKSIGRDINENALKITKECLNFEGDYLYEPKIEIGDTRELIGIEDQSVDLILTHPPYLNIIKYSEGKISNDLSNISAVEKFCNEFEKAIKEYYRVMKENSYCAILIGDTRKSNHFVPLSFYIMEIFLKNGFILKEDIIKTQHNCSSTPYWKNLVNKYNFMLIIHEHLFIFRKPSKNEDKNRFRNSMIKTK